MLRLKSLVLVALALVVAACGQPSSESKEQAADAKDSAVQATEQATEQAAEKAAEVAGPDIADLMAKADPEKGARLFLQCRACHSLEEGGINKVGPNLYGMFDKAAGQAADFVYSDALLNAGVTWDDASMAKWLERPAEFVPGNRMVFVGIRDPQGRADLIAYLRQQTGGAQ